MPKSNFLLLDLNEKRIKKLTKTITGDTSRKILNHLVEKEDTEANIAKTLKIPISTVHYHLQQLQEASLVLADEFHYSAKGREVNHYKLANKYIIIAPRKETGLRDKLRKILPVGLIALGISAVFGVIATFTGKIGVFSGAGESLTESKLVQSLETVVEDTATTTAGSGGGAEVVKEAVTETTSVVTSEPNVVLWFFMGVLVATIIFLTILLIRKYLKKRRVR